MRGLVLTRVLGYLTAVHLALLGFPSVSHAAADEAVWGCLTEHTGAAALPELVRGYLENFIQFERGGPEARGAAAGDCQARIAELLLHESGASRIDEKAYLDGLRYIERVDKKSPVVTGALALLAYGLQKSWERKFGDEFYLAKSNRFEEMEISTRLALGVGLAQAYAGSARPSWRTARYFEVLRTWVLNPAGAAARGQLAGEWIGRLTGRPVPPPPCSVLSSAFPFAPDAVAEAEEQAFLREIVGMAAGAAVGGAGFGAAAHALEGMAEKGIGPRPLRGALWVGAFLASMYAGYQVEQASQQVLSGARESKLAVALAESTNDLFATARAKKRTLLLAARRVVGLALSLEAEREYPLLKAELDRRTRAQAGAQAAAEARSKYEESVKSELAKGLGQIDPAVARAVARHALMSLRETQWDAAGIAQARASIAAMSEPFAFWAKTYLDLYLAQKKKAADFGSYLKRADETDQATLLREIRGPSGKGVVAFSTSADRMLLETAAVLDSMGSDYLTTYARELLLDRLRVSAVMRATFNKAPTQGKGDRK